MSSESKLREKAREAIKAGKLPSHRPKRMWGGPGVGARCRVCGKLVARDEVEFELEFARDDESRGVDNYHVHLRCFAAWEFERQKFEPVDGTLTSNARAELAVPSVIAD